MLWRGRRASGNVIDRRGSTGRRPFSFGSGGGGFRLPGGLGGGGGLGRLGGGGWIGLIIVVGVALLFGSNLFNGGGGSGTVSPGTEVSTPEQEELVQFVSVVLADTEDVWHEVFQQEGRSYDEPKLVLFTGAVESACGYADAAVGPFYCPGDQQVYLDLSFFQEMARRFGAPGDFAQAYVVAHEVGHHVQQELGIMTQVNELRSRASEVESNELSVRLELQADCFAGVFANHADETKGVLEPGDIQEAMDAAAAIGDDKLQKDATGTVRPDSFTHGTSAQRQKWFNAGYKGGKLTSCDTFSPATP
jgi:predicted metalloprotease